MSLRDRHLYQGGELVGYGSPRERFEVAALAGEQRPQPSDP